MPTATIPRHVSSKNRWHDNLKLICRLLQVIPYTIHLFLSREIINSLKKGINLKLNPKSPGSHGALWGNGNSVHCHTLVDPDMQMEILFNMETLMEIMDPVFSWLIGDYSRGVSGTTSISIRNDCHMTLGNQCCRWRFLVWSVLQLYGYRRIIVVTGRRNWS